MCFLLSHVLNVLNVALLLLNVSNKYLCVFSQQVPQGVHMACPLSPVHLPSSLPVQTPQWGPHHQGHLMVCPCMFLQGVPFPQECPLHLGPWAMMDLITLRELPLVCPHLGCPPCPVWEVHHPMDFHQRWECHQMVCHRHLIHQVCLLSAT